MNSNTTTLPTLDLSKLLDLRDRYAARMAELLAGIDRRDPEAIAEAEAFIAEESDVIDDLIAQMTALAPAGDTDGYADAVLELVAGLRVIPGVDRALDEMRTAIMHETAAAIAERVRAFAEAEIRAHEAILAGWGDWLIGQHLDTFVTAVTSSAS